MGMMAEEKLRDLLSIIEPRQVSTGTILTGEGEHGKVAKGDHDLEVGRVASSVWRRRCGKEEGCTQAPLMASVRPYFGTVGFRHREKGCKVDPLLLTDGGDVNFGAGDAGLVEEFEKKSPVAPASGYPFQISSAVAFFL